MFCCIIQFGVWCFTNDKKNKDTSKEEKKKRESGVVKEVLNANWQSMKKSNIQQYYTQSPDTSASKVWTK